MNEICPDCGSGFATPHHSRNGWHYAQCDRRWHGEHGWEPSCPTACLRRQVANRDTQIAELKSQLARLQAIVDKLPKTADGVIITPGRTFYELWGTAPAGIRSLEVADWYDREDDSPVAAAEIYSTREAAEAAKENAK